MTDTAQTPATNQRRFWFIILGAVVLAAAVLYAIYWLVYARYFESTDDAYVGANLVQVTSQTNGTVIAIGADDTDFVAAGHALVQLDRADAKVTLDQAEAQLAKAVRGARNLFATASQLKATVDMRRSDLQRAQQDYASRQRLAASGAVSGIMAAAIRFVFQPGESLSGFSLDASGTYRAPALPLIKTFRDRRTLRFILLWLAINILTGLAGVPLGLGEGSIAWEAHVGGFFTGLVVFSWVDPPMQDDPSLLS